MRRGISLIVLVITIIVLIILASVGIMTLNQSGMLNKAQDATNNYSEKTAVEKLIITLAPIRVDAELDGIVLADYISYNNVTNRLDDVITFDTIAEGDEEITFHVGTYEIKTDLSGNVISSEGDNNNQSSNSTFVNGVETPKLGERMTPVYWNGTTEVVTNASDTNWYNYSQNKWANVKMDDGSYFVWIPRFEYKVNQRTTTGNTAGTIDVNFVSKETTNATEGYTIHPAFRNDVANGGWDTELSGIWVAKYEASGSTSALLFKPGVQSLRNTIIGDMYTAALRYNNSLESHMMKNSEWGAVAILAHSSYGRNGVEVTTNTNSSYYTAGSKNAIATTNVLQSTTGNATGVFDMSGGAYEYMAAYANNGNNSKLTNYGKKLVEDNQTSTKYVTVYIANASYTPDNNKNSIQGDAIYELSGENTTSWFGDYSICCDEDDPFFARGGCYDYGETAGIFASGDGNGYNYARVGFRVVLVP